MEVDLVDAVTASVMGPQDRLANVCEPGVLLSLRGAGQHPELVHLGLSPAAALPVQRSQQRCVVSDVELGQRRT
jgi:hypothetical protein